MKHWLSFRYADREEGTGVEVRAGLTLYAQVGYVGADQHTEAGSRTLDYACSQQAPWSPLFLTLLDHS